MIRLDNAFRFHQMASLCRGLLNNQKIAPACTQQVAGSKSLVDSVNERLGLPPRPKKPLTPYFRFLKENRPLIVQQNPNMGLTEIVREAAKKWNGVDASIKKKLEDDYKSDQAEYLKKRAQYDSKLTDEQKEELKHLKYELMQSRKDRVVKKEKNSKLREFNKPKRPQSSFLEYLNSERSKTPQGSMSYREWQQKIASKWAALSDAEKAPFFRIAKEHHDAYKLELQKWEEKMIKLGHPDIVRSSSLIQADEQKREKGSRKAKSPQ